jgi:hypothetical protein
MEVAHLKAQHQRQRQQIAAQACIIGSLKKKLKNRLVEISSTDQTSQDTLSVSRPDISQSHLRDDEMLVLPLVDATSEKNPATASSCESADATCDDTWSSISSLDFRYTIDTSACSSFRSSFFSRTTSRRSLHLRCESAMKNPMSLSRTSPWAGHDQLPGRDASNSQVEHFCSALTGTCDRSYPARRGRRPINIDRDRRCPKYTWSPPSARRPFPERRRLLEDFLRRQAVS